MVEGDVHLADLGEGIAALAELHSKRRLARRHPRRVDRLVRSHCEGFPERGPVLAGRLDSGQLHFGETVERTRLGLERDDQFASGRPRSLHSSPDQRVVIAAGAKQLGEQVGILAGAAVDLRCVGRVLCVAGEGRERIERLPKRRFGLGIESLDARRV